MTWPSSILIISLKLASSELSNDLLSRVKFICNLWAPLAAKLLVPVALSSNVVSDSGVTIVSVMVNPTLAFGLGVSYPKTNVCAELETNWPLTKYTPALTLTTEPTVEAASLGSVGLNTLKDETPDP